MTFRIVWTPQLLAEVEAHRLSDTFGGYLWPVPYVPTRLPTDEVVVELEWLLDGGMPNWEAARVLGKRQESLVRLCERAGRNDLAARMRPRDEARIAA